MGNQQFVHFHIDDLLSRIVFLLLVVIHAPKQTRIPFIPRVLAPDLSIGQSLVLVLLGPTS